MAKLIVRRGNSRGTVYDLTEDEVSIGRDFENMIQVTDQKASRHHARIVREGNKWILADLDSRNGTYLNSIRVKREELTSMNEIEIGEALFLFIADEFVRRGLSSAEDRTDDWETPSATEVISGERVELLKKSRIAKSRQEVEQVNECLITLFNFSNECNQVQSLQELMQNVSEAADAVLESDRIVPIVVDRDAGGLIPWFREKSSFDRQLSQAPISTSIVKHARDEKMAVLSGSTSADTRFQSSPSVTAHRISTAMCAPIRAGDRVLGLLYVDRLGKAEDYTRNDLELLIAMAMPMVAAIQNIYAMEDMSRERQELIKEVRGRYNIVGQSAEVREIFEFIERSACVDSSVLIAGESGTGKELVARAIHYSGSRSNKPFEVVNCGAIAPALLESELFGHVRGAFTGAHADRCGRFELANKGTLFLDEIGELPEESQAKLLRVLEHGEIRRVGDTRDRRVDVRILAATNKNLAEEMENRTFRQDLFYRLNVLNIALPPLRERKDDIELLCDHFLKVFAQQCGRTIRGFTPEAMARLRSYPWPGNVRELKNTIERMTVMSSADLLDVGDLPYEVKCGPARPEAVDAGEPVTLSHVERVHVLRVLEHTKGNKKEAAAILGIDRSTLYAKLKAYGLDTSSAEQS